MKTRTKIIIGAIALALIGGGIAMGQVFGFGEDFPSKTMTQKEKQVAFLKEHEQEITTFIQSKYSEVNTVEYDWSSVKVGNSGPFTEEGLNIRLKVFGKNKKELNGYTFFIVPSPTIETPKAIKSITGINFP